MTVFWQQEENGKLWSINILISTLEEWKVCENFYSNVLKVSASRAGLSLQTLTHDCVSYVSMHMEDIKYMSNKIKQVIKYNETPNLGGSQQINRL